MGFSCCANSLYAQQSKIDKLTPLIIKGDDLNAEDNSAIVDKITLDRIKAYNDAERRKIDSLTRELLQVKNVSAKVELLTSLGNEYRNFSKPDSFIICFRQALELIQKNKLPVVKELDVLGGLDFLTNATGDYAMSMYYANRALQLSEETNVIPQKAFALANIAGNYSGMGDFRKALDYYFRAKKIFKTYESGHWAIQNIAETYLKMHMVDSALYYNRIAYHIADTGHNQHYMKAFAIRTFACIYKEKGQIQMALNHYRKFISDFYQHNLNNREIGHAYFAVAKIYEQEGNLDSTIYYARQSLQAAQMYTDQEHVAKSSNLLYHINDSLNNESLAFKYFKIAAAAKDSIASIEKIRHVQMLTFNEQLREKQQAEIYAREAARTRLILSVFAILILIISFLVWNRLRQLRTKHKMVLEQREVEKMRAIYEKNLLELEAKALRSQMNPHFIFNCMNSIKSLIQRHEEEKSVNYLTTFSKLIRTLFNNADKKEISLYDEIETCKLYLQLEAMRFDSKFSFTVKTDENLDLKSVLLPALIIQPFIENAIWHGIVPKGIGGHVELCVLQTGSLVQIIIDDNGIGRLASKQNKPASSLMHQSKGLNLTQSRLELDNQLRQRQANLEIIDKTNEQGLETGTRVTITINEELP